MKKLKKNAKNSEKFKKLERILVQNYTYSKRFTKRKTCRCSFPKQKKEED